MSADEVKTLVGQLQKALLGLSATVNRHAWSETVLAYAEAEDILAVFRQRWREVTTGMPSPVIVVAMNLEEVCVAHHGEVEDLV